MLIGVNMVYEQVVFLASFRCCDCTTVAVILERGRAAFSSGISRELSRFGDGDWIAQMIDLPIMIF